MDPPTPTPNPISPGPEFMQQKSAYIAKLHQQREQEQLAEWRERLNRHEVVLKDAPDFVKSDKNALIAAVKHDPFAYLHADESLKNDREIFYATLENSTRDSYMLLKYATKFLKKDKEVVLAAIKNDVRSFEFAHKSLQCDKDFCCLVMKQNGAALRYAHDSMRGEKEVVLAAVQQDSRSFQFAKQSMKSDSDVVIAAMKKFSRKKNKEADFAAKNKRTSSSSSKGSGTSSSKSDSLQLFNVDPPAEQDSDGRNFALELYEKNKDVLPALKQDRPNIPFTPELREKDKELALAAMKLRGAAFESFKLDEELVLVVMKQNNIHSSLPS